MAEQKELEISPDNSTLAVYRILDANLDRAREGIRVIEDWCRLGLQDGAMAAICKDLRQNLAVWHSNELRAARDTPKDPGTELTHAQEEIRENVAAILQANFCRIQEALRVLEEYSKLYNSQMAQEVKQMRYQIYTLESNLLTSQRQQQLAKAHLYLVTSSRDDLISVVESALQGGLPIVQYREKNADDGVKFATAQKLCRLCHHYGALFIVNDRPDLALAVDADGVHLGQQDLPVEFVRQLLGSHKIIGQSTTNPQEMQRAIDSGVDYLGVGPVYETPTKPGKAAAGLSYIRYAAAHATVPWFAIGGIDTTNFSDVLNAGCDRLAVVRSLMDSEQPTLTTQFFLSQITRWQTMKNLEKS
jgi:thiamine-phosphate pyrophosphorylase